MNIFIIGIFFIIIWLVTTFFIFRYIKILRNDLLKKISDTEKTPEKSEHIPKKNIDKPFDNIKGYNPKDILNFIKYEHPQIIALILAHLEPYKASIILENLPFYLQGDVSLRIATMDRVSPEIIREIERVLEKKLLTLPSGDAIAVGGVENIVEILQLVDHDSEKKIIEALEKEFPELAEEIKKRLFVFEDILILYDCDIQKIMREVDSKELAKALKSVDSEVQDKIFKNMSKFAVCRLKKDMNNMIPIPLKDVEESQQKIVSVIRHLEDKGEIEIPRFAKDELVV